MLSDVVFKNSYSTGFDEPKEFFTEALIESSAFDLGLGFFSSSAIRSLAYGFAIFIANGGKMRVIINHILSDQDKQAIEAGQNHLTDTLESDIIADINKLAKTLSKEDEHFFKCLSYLISINRIEFIATISTKGGLGHDKYGIFTDCKGKKIAFIGSANFSQTALELNGETITVFAEEKDNNRITEYQSLFNESWEGDTKHLIHIPLNNVKTHIQGVFPKETLDELIAAGVNLREFDAPNFKTIKTSLKPLPKRIIDRIEIKEKEPRFPFPEERDIQIKAYSTWIKNERKGIFAMATGSGKTVTALNCLLKQYRETGYYRAIIAVPTQALALQWTEEAKAFRYSNVVCSHTDKDWKDTLTRYAMRSLFVEAENLVFITTYATFIRSFVQKFLAHTKTVSEFIYIADEAHNMGSPTVLAKMPEMIKYRIGLSAAPERVYDESGSEKLYQYFNSRPPQYTYRFTMKDAIDQKILCKYNYFPVFVELTEFEMSEYEKITSQLRKFIDPLTGKYKPDADKLLLKRKRIVHKAQNKKIAIQQLLDSLQENKKLKYTFVFVPEGFEPDYAKSDVSTIDSEDIHILDEYADMFKSRKYSYHKYISGLDDSPEILDAFSRGDIDVLLSMKCLDEGVDIPRAQYAIFCSSTGNPRQFVQRRGRVLRKCAGKDMASIWDLIVVPPGLVGEGSAADRNMFVNEVKRVLNFAALADNRIDIMYGKLKSICEELSIDVFQMLEDEYKQYN